ncbi:MAG TPA: DUF5696 domain-containing protein [Candidatus Limnocylindria bacterium]|nr:DUF5696 domain-containing protein [Candidatus Limnocylindria bacterium]
MSRTARKVLLRVVLALVALGGVAYLGWRLYGGGAGAPAQSGINPSFSSDTSEYVLENEHLRLALDGATTHFTVTSKADGHIWNSVPAGADTDPIALAGTRNLLKSTLALTYSTRNGTRTLFDNFEYSIRNQVYEIEADESRIRVDYTLGRIARAFIIPTAVTVERMNGFLAQMTQAQSRKILDSYRKYDPDRLSQDQKAELLRPYPILEQGPIYVLRDNARDFLKAEFEDLFEAAGYTYDDYLQDQAAGSGAARAGAVFSVSVEYTLQGRDLVVSVPLDSIKYSADFQPVRLGVLPNFGAGGVQDEGYMLVPEGGGALIRFNNGKTAQNNYYADVYGWDHAVSRKVLVHEPVARLPVFGVASGGSAFLCMLEEQASGASIAADVSGRNTSFNTVSATYTLLRSDAFNVTDRTIETIYMYEATLPKGALRQRYRFVPTGDPVELAKAYREYLVSRYPGLTPLEDGRAPVAVEILGAIDKVQQRAGIPVSAPVRLTGWDEALGMIREAASWADARLHVRLSGWMNGGLNQKLASAVRPVTQLGSVSGLDALARGANDAGARLYLGGITQYALDSGILDGFLYVRDAARFTTREAVALHPYSVIWYGLMELYDPHWLLKPRVAATMADNLASYARAKGAAGIAPEDYGLLLSADYDPKDTVTREEAMGMQAAQAKAIADSGLGLMVRGGNLYALEHADLVTDMDLRGVPYAILDEAVPFAQVALHGLVPYTGRALNMAADPREELLLSAQRGAGLYYVFMAERPDILHDTDYAMFYGATWDVARERAEETVRDYAAKMDGLANLAITGFRDLGNGVTETAYEGGARVLVNFANEARTAGGVAVPARDFVTLRPEAAP